MRDWGRGNLVGIVHAPNKNQICLLSQNARRYTQVVYNNPAVLSDKAASSRSLEREMGQWERDIKSRHYVESGGGDVYTLLT